MKKLFTLLCILTLVFGLGLSASYAAPPFENQCANGTDDDGDGLVDCDDPDCDGDSDCTSSCTISEDPEATCDDAVDNDCDGLVDCDDSDCDGNSACSSCTISEDPEATCDDAVDNDCDGLVDCDDSDCDGNSACGSSTTEDCKDGVDNDGDGLIDCADSDCSAEPSCEDPNHSGINQYDGPQTCIECHTTAGSSMLGSVHGTWFGATPDVTNIQDSTGKWGQSNNYCTDPEMADFACLKCHVSLVAPVDANGDVDMSASKLTEQDMDCMQCHQNVYQATFEPDPDTATDYVSCFDGEVRTYVTPVPEADGKIHKKPRFDLMPAGTTMVELARTVHIPDNASCLLPCHANAGGGDGIKRGDLGSSMVDPDFTVDVHLSSAGTAQLVCASCHATTNHKIPGRGNDLRPTDADTMKKCVDCHAGFDGGGAHADAGARVEPDRHVARVDCTACHINVYGKGTNTEMTRDWTQPKWKADGCEGQGAYVGTTTKGVDVTPDYRFWNNTSWVYNRNGTDGLLVDPSDPGTLTFSYPNGGIQDGKLYPFKKHFSWNPVEDGTNVTNFDVLQMFMTGCYEDAAVDGLAYIGATGPYTWKNTVAYQLITHGIGPSTDADDCDKCHHGKGEFEYDIETKLDKLGYKLKDDPALICSQCHAEKAFKNDWEQMHKHTGKGSGVGCTFCHDVERFERGLCEPCNPDGTENTACIDEFVDTNYYDHCTP